MLKCTAILFTVLFFFSLKGQNSYQNLGLKTNNVDSVIFYLEKRIKLTKASKDTAQLIEETCLLARNYVVKSNYLYAEKLIKGALMYALALEDEVFKGKLFMELASVYRHEGKYSESLEYYLKASDLFENLSEWHYTVQAKTQTAEFYRKFGKHKIALEYINSSLSDFENYKLADTALLIYIYNRTAAIVPDDNLRIKNSKRALVLASLTNNENAQATSYNELGFIYKHLTKLDSSEYFYKKAENIWFSMGAYREGLNALNNRVMLYLHNGYNEDLAISLSEKIIDITLNNGINFPLKDAYAHLSSYYLRQKDYEKSREYLQNYHESVVEELHSNFNKEVISITERYETKKAKEEAKRISDELANSLALLEQEELYNKKLVLLLLALVILIALIVFLLVRINKVNKILKIRNKEKDILIQEIHHRVKNNLQFISSLINMQVNSSSDDREKHSLSDTSRRIRAMSLVHEMLYNHKEQQGVSIKNYLEELILLIDQLVNTKKIPISFHTDIEDRNCSVSDSIALGMITSELISNSIKHAFSKISHPEIIINLKRVNDSILFQIKDNGKGRKKRLDKPSNSLGLRLIDIFSRQLKGTYSIDTERGYSYTLDFDFAVK